MNTDWPATEYAMKLTDTNYKLAVPLTLLYLTPPAVAFIGMLDCQQNNSVFSNFYSAISR